MTQSIEQPNGINEGFLRVPYELYQLRIGGKKPGRCILTVLSAIYSFTKREQSAENGPEKVIARCELSYRAFSERYHISRASVWRAVHAASDDGIISKQRQSVYHASYEFNLSFSNEDYITTDDFLFRTRFSLKNGESIFLPKSAIDVLGLIRGHAENKKGKGYFEGSVRGIMRTLCLSKTTVQKSISLLLSLQLIFRRKEHCGRNGYFRSRYTVNEKLLRSKNRAYKREFGKFAADVRQTAEKRSGSDLRAERERFYEELRRQDQDRIDSFRNKLDRDAVYTSCNRELRSLEPQIARLELNGESGKLGELRKKYRALSDAVAERMKKLGIFMEDISPKYRCRECQDTGFRVTDGRLCSCFPRRRE